MTEQTVSPLTYDQYEETRIELQRLLKEDPEAFYNAIQRMPDHTTRPMVWYLIRDFTTLADSLKEQWTNED